MSQINFVEQFRLFMEYARKNAMHSRECMLWVSLFYLANEEATYNADTQTYEWPDGFFEVSNGELNSYGKFDKQAVEALRNRLKQRGLIDFIKGNRNSATPMYKINYLIRSGNKIIPNNNAKEHAKDDANPYANNTPKEHAKEDANPHANIPPFNININTTEDGSTGLDSLSEDEEDHSRVREEIESAWLSAFGRKPTPIIVDELANRAENWYAFEPGIIAKAIRMAGFKEAADPFAYVIMVLGDWHASGVRTNWDCDEYCAIWDSHKIGPWEEDHKDEKLREFRERHAARA